VIRGRAVVLAAAFLVVSAPVAHAATVSVRPNRDGPAVFYDAAAGETNRVTVRVGPGPEATIKEENASVAVGAGCSRVDPQTVACSGFTEPVFLILGDGDDALTVTEVTAVGGYVLGFGGLGADVLNGCGTCSVTFLGEQGDDNLTAGGRSLLDGGGGNDTLRGAEGRQELNGNGGHDVISGGEDADLIYPGRGDDSVDGGGGRDRVSYSDRIPAGPVMVDLRHTASRPDKAETRSPALRTCSVPRLATSSSGTPALTASTGSPATTSFAAEPATTC
jgi:Ca2+-binding RTX toxin-like protein